MQGQQKTFLVTVLVFLVAIILGFGVGVSFQRARDVRMGAFYNNDVGSSRNYGMMRRGNFPGMGLGMMGRAQDATTGQITAIAGNQVTIKLFDGSTRQVTLSPTTTYTKVGSATQANLQQGENVQVVGQTAQNGTISAQTVRISSQ